jgi:hypothetical protein
MLSNRDNMQKKEKTNHRKTILLIEKQKTNKKKN